MKFKRMIALLLCVATMFTLVSAEVYAADYTITIKSNDGTTTLFTATVASGTVITFTTNGLSLSTGETYSYEGENDFLGFNTSSGKTVVTYAAGMTYTVTGALTLYLVEGEKVAHTIVGDAVEGATSYELYRTNEPVTLHDDYPYYMIVYWKDCYKDGSIYKDKYYCFNMSIVNESLKRNYSVLNLKLILTFASSTYIYQGVGETVEEAISDCMSSEKSTYANEFVFTNTTLTTNNNQFFEVLYWTAGVNTVNSDYGGIAEKDFSVANHYEVSQLRATSSSLYFDLEELDLSVGKYDFVVKAQGEGYYDSDYSNVVEYTHVERHPVTYETTNATITNIDGGEAMANVYDTHPLSVKIQPADGYLQPDSVTVTVDGTALTSGYSYDSATGNLVILSVKGDVVITAQGIRKVAAPVIAREGSLETKDYPVVLMFDAVANASGYSVYVDGTATTAVETTETDGLVTIKLKSELFPKSATYSVYVVAEPVDGYTVSDASNTISATVAVQIATPVATAAPDLRTEEYPFVCKVTKPDNATSLMAYLNGNSCGTLLVYETDANGDWIVYVPTSVIDGSGEYELYFVAIGESTDYVESESSNRLTFTISKLATPVIWLE